MPRGGFVLDPEGNLVRLKNLQSKNDLLCVRVRHVLNVNAARTTRDVGRCGRRLERVAFRWLGT